MRAFYLLAGLTRLFSYKTCSTRRDNSSKNLLKLSAMYRKRTVYSPIGLLLGAHLQQIFSTEGTSCRLRHHLTPAPQTREKRNHVSTHYQAGTMQCAPVIAERTYWGYGWTMPCSSQPPEVHRCSALITRHKVRALSAVTHLVTTKCASFLHSINKLLTALTSIRSECFFLCFVFLLERLFGLLFFANCVFRCLDIPEMDGGDNELC